MEGSSLRFDLGNSSRARGGHVRSSKEVTVSSLVDGLASAAGAAGAAGSAFDQGKLRALKQLARLAGGESMGELVRILMAKLAANNSLVRLRVVRLIDIFFMRSKLFRRLLLPSLEPFLALSLGFQNGQLLPPPQQQQSRLKAEALEALERWLDAFGWAYRQLPLAVDFLQRVKKIELPKAVDRERTQRSKEREREARGDEIRRKKYERLKDSFEEKAGEVRRVVSEAQSCLQLLRDAMGNGEARWEGVVGEQTTGVDAAFANDEDDDPELDESNGLCRSALRSAVMAVERDEAARERRQENDGLMDALSGTWMAVESRHMPEVQEWLTLLTRVDPVDHHPRDEMLRRTIDMKRAMEEVCSGCDAAGVKRQQQGRSKGRSEGSEGRIGVGSYSRSEAEGGATGRVEGGEIEGDEEGEEDEVEEEGEEGDVEWETSTGPVEVGCERREDHQGGGNCMEDIVENEVEDEEKSCEVMQGGTSNAGLVDDVTTDEVGIARQFEQNHARGIGVTKQGGTGAQFRLSEDEAERREGGGGESTRLMKQAFIWEDMAREKREENEQRAETEVDASLDGVGLHCKGDTKSATGNEEVQDDGDHRYGSSTANDKRHPTGIGFKERANGLKAMDLKRQREARREHNERVLRAAALGGSREAIEEMAGILVRNQQARGNSGGRGGGRAGRGGKPQMSVRDRIAKRLKSSF